MLLSLTRAVGPAVAQCQLTHLPRTSIDVVRAVAQHDGYEACLRELGCQVRRLPAEPECPDCVFIEDTCVVFDEFALITRPGAESRRRETTAVEKTMTAYRTIHRIESPGTLDGGDVLCIGRRIFVGCSSRSNRNGIDQLRQMSAAYGYSVMEVALKGCLHLKSAVTVVADNTVLVNPSWADPAVFECARTICVEHEEPMAANALRVGSSVIYPSAFPKTQRRLEDSGLDLRLVDMSELAKAEGGVTCCSLIFRSSSD